MQQLKSIPKNIRGEKRCSQTLSVTVCMDYIRLKILFPMQEVYGTESISHFPHERFRKMAMNSSGVLAINRNPWEELWKTSLQFYFFFRRIGIFFFAFDLNQNDVENSIFFAFAWYLCLFRKRTLSPWQRAEKKHTTYKNSTKGNTFRVESWFEI